MSGPRVIKRHGFVERNLHKQFLTLNPQQERLNELCALATCRLPYEAPVHWVLDETPDGLGQHEFTTGAIRISKKTDVCDYGARCKRPENDPIHKVDDKPYNQSIPHYFSGNLGEDCRRCGLPDRSTVHLDWESAMKERRQP